MDIEEYEPISTLVVKENIITKAKYPFIDVHNHQFDMPLKNLSKLLSLLTTSKKHQIKRRQHIK